MEKGSTSDTGFNMNELFRTRRKNMQNLRFSNKCIGTISLFAGLLLMTAPAPAADTVVVIPLGGAAEGNAVAAEVLTGKTFSNSDEKGITGTMPDNGTVTITPSTVNQTIAEGYHNGNGAVAGDTDLVPGNIVNNVEIFGVTGTSATATGDAVATDVLTGKTFSNSSATGVAGTMADNGAFNLTCGAGGQTVNAGYTSGGTLPGDADLAAGNIAAGVDIFGFTGTALISTGDAVAADVLTGKTFSNSGATGVTGTMADNGAFNLTCGAGGQTVDAGYTSGGTLPGDTDLAAGNIAAGVDIFGFIGTFTGGGTYYSAAVPQTGQSTAYDANTPQKDDGALQRGVTWTAATRFTDNGDGTITDTLTGLIWLQDANCMGANYPDRLVDGDSNEPLVDCTTDPVTDPDVTGECTDGKVFWQTSLNFVAGVNAGTYPLCNSTSPLTDWRLPNILELESLRDLGENSPAMPTGHPFTNVNSLISWSSTTARGFPGNAWGVHFQKGLVYDQIKASNDHAFMLVRGGQ